MPGTNQARRQSGQPLGFKIALASLAIVLSLGLCELGARVAFPAPPVAHREPQIAYLFDPELRYVLAPSQKGWIDDGLVTVNSMGFRGPEVVTPKPQGRFRVVVLGDSLTLGWSVADDDAYPARVERLLRGRFPVRALDVVNLGVGGYNTRQEVSLLARHLAPLAPDLVLVGFYSNDVPESVDGAGMPAAGGAQFGHPGTPRAGERMYLNPTPAVWWQRQLRRSRLVYLAGRAFNRFRGAGDWGRTQFLMEIELLEGKHSAVLERAWATVGTQFTQLSEMAKSDGFVVGIVMLPSRELVTGQYPPAPYQSRVRAIAEPLGFHVIDPLPLMREQDSSGLYIPYDRNHPSAEGHALIAEAIASYLTEHQMVAPRP